MTTRRKFKDEFQWEREIRCDEERISCYYRELSSCLDLPGEPSIIINNLMAQPGLFPENISSVKIRILNYEDDIFSDIDFDEDLDSEEHLYYRKFNEALTEVVDKMVCSWNSIFASKVNAKNQNRGLAISCAISKAFVRISEYSMANAPEKSGLKICLGKRSIQDINDTITLMFELTECQKNLSKELAPLIEELQLFREHLIDLLSIVRKGVSE